MRIGTIVACGVRSMPWFACGHLTRAHRAQASLTASEQVAAPARAARAGHQDARGQLAPGRLCQSHRVRHPVARHTASPPRTPDRFVHDSSRLRARRGGMGDNELASTSLTATATMTDRVVRASRMRTKEEVFFAWRLPETPATAVPVKRTC
jgi:hypothetical protein